MLLQELPSVYCYPERYTDVIMLGVQYQFVGDVGAQVCINMDEQYALSQNHQQFKLTLPPQNIIRSSLQSHSPCTSLHQSSSLF
jgi:hypothetical protein